MLQYSFIGNQASIEKELIEFIEQTSVNEIMATSHIYDHTARVHSYELFAGAMEKLNGR
jgi:hypothetical protein